MDLKLFLRKFAAVTASAAALAAVVPAAPVAAQAMPESDLPESIVNGDFELPSVSGIVNDENESDRKWIEWDGFLSN